MYDGAELTQALVATPGDIEAALAVMKRSLPPKRPSGRRIRTKPQAVFRRYCASEHRRSLQQAFCENEKTDYPCPGVTGQAWPCAMTQNKTEAEGPPFFIRDVSLALRVPWCGGEELREKTNHQPQAEHRDNEQRKRRHRFESGRYAVRKVELAQSHPGTDEKNRQRPHHPDARVKN
jgi:hypothetical protein